MIDDIIFKEVYKYLNHNLLVCFSNMKATEIDLIDNFWNLSIICRGQIP